MRREVQTFDVGSTELTLQFNSWTQIDQPLLNSLRNIARNWLPGGPLSCLLILQKLKKNEKNILLLFFNIKLEFYVGH